jgi:uncharacterized protein (DUF362 family)
MGKIISRREFLHLAALGTVCVGSEMLLANCQVKPEPISSPSPYRIPVENKPIASMVLGKARGVKPGRVVWAHNPDATLWDGLTGYWWAPESIAQPVVDDMLRQSLCQLSGQSDSANAWAMLFEHFNMQHGRPELGYRAGEKVAIKINLNTSSSYNNNHNNTFSAPHVILALLKQLVEVVGINPEDIVVYDAVRYVPDCIYDACKISELQGIHFADFAGTNGREKCIPDSGCTVHWSEDVGGSTTYLPTCVTQADYLINLAGLKAHGLAGVTLCAKNHCGTIQAELDNKPTMQAPQGANIHGYIAALDYDYGPGWQWKRRTMGSYNALVDMMGHRHLGEKTLLFVIEGLYAAPHQQATLTQAARWQSSPFNGGWTSSLFMSMDGVAIDSVAYDFLIHEPTIAGNPEVMPLGHTAENYLHEAALADKPDSGAHYCPDGEGTSLSSLGVHEHWDDASTKQYSRNRADGEGIELVTIS